MSNSIFTPRLTRPEAGNPYYNTKAAGGYSDASKGDRPALRDVCDRLQLPVKTHRRWFFA